MHPPRIQSGFLCQTMTLPLRCIRPQRHFKVTSPTIPSRCFSSTPSTQNWLLPKKGAELKTSKGKPRCATGGSVRGTTVVWGDYGLRMKDMDRRISSSHLRVAEETIKKRLRGTKYRLYHRVAANIPVYTSGNDQRMGKGKGSFDFWATRVAVSRILFEIKGDVHEQVIRDAFRLAGNKLPGLYEFAKKGDPPVMGITKLGGLITKESLYRPRKAPEAPSDAATAERLPSGSPEPSPGMP